MLRRLPDAVGAVHKAIGGENPAQPADTSPNSEMEGTKNFVKLTICPGKFQIKLDFTKELWGGGQETKRGWP